MLIFPTIKISEDTPFKRGESYGSQAAYYIGVCINTYKTALARADVKWEIAQGVAMRYLKWTEESENMPDMVDEIKGIASGSGMDLMDIAVINCAYELLHFPKECTAFALQREATLGGHVILGQNWDQDPRFAAHAVLLDILEEETGNHIFGLSEAGQLIKSGICIHKDGSATAICGNSILSNLDKVGIGCPTSVLRRKALTFTRMEHILNLVTGSARSVSSNINVATTENEIRAIELLPEVVEREDSLLIDPYYILDSMSGAVTHDNSIRSVPQIDMMRHGHPRGTHLKILFSEATGRIDLNYIKRCLSDHEGYPGSICSHGCDENDNWQTIASVIYDLDAHSAHVCCGAPCTNDYIEFKL
ncbi:MAG: hypothetical protein J5928_05865 [Firmicutes bacterium]|nr:hypothetical protein [Bacillota bacterium]